MVGERGTVMMPTFSGGGRAYRYAKSAPAPFDPERAPATAGTLPERFRRWPGVRRSLHPTHSVAARGPQAARLLEGHEKSETPFGTTAVRAPGAAGGQRPAAQQQRQQPAPPDPRRRSAGRTSSATSVRARSDAARRGGACAPCARRCTARVCHKVVLPGREAGDWRLLHLPWYGLQFMVPDAEREELPAAPRRRRWSSPSGRRGWCARGSCASAARDTGRPRCWTRPFLPPHRR